LTHNLGCIQPQHDTHNRYQRFLENAAENGFLNKRGSLCFASTDVLNSKRVSKKKKSIIKDYLEKLIELTNFLSIETLPNLRLSYVKNNITEENYLCQVLGCTNPRQYWGSGFFAKTCECRDEAHQLFINTSKHEGSKEVIIKTYGVTNVSKLASIKEKKKKTFKKNYGTDNIFSSDVFKENAKEIYLKTLGVENPSQSSIVKLKKKETCLKNRGTENPMQSLEIQERSKRTNLLKYGFEYSLQSPEVQARSKETNLLKYGFENPFQSPEVQEQIKRTNLLKYGAEYPTQAPEVQERSKQTNLERYGAEYPMQVLGKIVSQLPTEGKVEYLKENYLDEKNKIKVHKLCKDTGCHKLYPIQLFKKLNIGFKPRSGSSRYEDHAVDYLKLLDPRTEIVRNSRKIIGPLELDIYLPEYNLAIEINGSAFHSEGESTYSILHRPDSNPERHRRKLKACLEKGIDLVQVFNEVATFEQLAFEKLLAYKMGKLKWPTNQRWYPHTMSIICCIDRTAIRSVIDANSKHA